MYSSSPSSISSLLIAGSGSLAAGVQAPRLDLPTRSTCHTVPGRLARRMSNMLPGGLLAPKRRLFPTVLRSHARATEMSQKGCGTVGLDPSNWRRRRSGRVTNGIRTAWLRRHRYNGIIHAIEHRRRFDSTSLTVSFTRLSSGLCSLRSTESGAAFCQRVRSAHGEHMSCRIPDYSSSSP